MPTPLSENFTLEELTKSQYAVRHEIDNTPGPEEIENLRALCENILQPVRDHFGKPFTPSSGYRNPEVNAGIGGSPTSQHMKGEAADFEVPGVSNAELADWIADAGLPYDQLILEFHKPDVPQSGWVHCSHKRDGNNRGERKTIGG